MAIKRARHCSLHIYFNRGSRHLISEKIGTRSSFASGAILLSLVADLHGCPTNVVRPVRGSSSYWALLHKYSLFYLTQYATKHPLDSALLVERKTPQTAYAGVKVIQSTLRPV